MCFVVWIQFNLSVRVERCDLFQVSLVIEVKQFETKIFQTLKDEKKKKKN